MDPLTSLLIVTFASLIGSVGQTLIYVKTVDPKKLQALQAELKDYLSQLEAAKKSSDKKLLKQLEKKRKYMDTLQSDVSSMTLKQSLITTIFALGIFFGLSYLLTPGEELAFLSTYLLTPSQSGSVQGLNWWIWYLISSLYISLLARKIMRVS